MPLTKAPVGRDPNTGLTAYAYVQDDASSEAGVPVVRTGPVAGVFTTSDGAKYDLTDDYVEVESHEHAGELNHLVAEHYERNGHPALEGEPFYHYCEDNCGPHKRDDNHPMQVAAREHFEDRHGEIPHIAAAARDAKTLKEQK